jgi:replicative DNA helicase
MTPELHDIKKEVAVKNLASLVVENIRQLEEGTIANMAIETGFERLDKLTGGFRLGELVVLGGRPSMGKTQFLVNLAAHISRTLPVLYVSFDLPVSQLSIRFISAVSGIPAHNILLGDLDDTQKKTLATIGNHFTARQVLVSEDCYGSIETLKELCEKHTEENGVHVIVVDYLQMLSSHGKYRHFNRESEVSHICRELKNIAKENKVCIIASSQLNRSAELRGGSKCPQLSDLRESGAIEQAADKIMFIHRPDYYGIRVDEDNIPLVPGLVEIIVAKNRNGPTDTIRLRRDSGFTSFCDYDDDMTDLYQFPFSPERLLELEKPF